MKFRFLTNFFRPWIDFLKFGNGILGVSGAKPLCSVVHCVNLQKYFLANKIAILNVKISISERRKFNFGERISSSKEKISILREKISMLGKKKWISAMKFRFLSNFFRPWIDFLRFGNGILGVSGAKPLCSVVHCVNLQKYFLAHKIPILNGEISILMEEN